MCRPKCCQGLRHQYARPSVPHVTQHYCMPHERDPKAYELVTSHDILNIYVWPFVIHAIHLKGHYLSRPWRGSGTHLGIPSYRCTDTPRACSTSHGPAHIPLHQLNSSAGDEDQNKKNCPVSSIVGLVLGVSSHRSTLAIIAYISTTKVLIAIMSSRVCL